MTHHILVVDDEPDIESLISQKFRRDIRQGKYAFSFASNGKEALQQVSATANIDMVLTDINMPVMDGLVLISQLNTLDNAPKTVVVSAYGDMGNIRAAMNNGAFDFVFKPISFQDLVATVEKTLKVVDQEKADRAKLEDAQVQLVQAEKMSSLGQMVAGVAHEINNPVNFIYGNLKPARNYVQDLMLLIDCYQSAYPEPKPEIQDCMEDIELEFLQTDLANLLDSLQIGASRIRDLVLSLRNFSRLDESDKKEVNIHEGIDSTLLLLSHRLQATSERPDIEVVCSYGTFPTISCYPGQLNQVIMNLVTNAIDALEACSEGKENENSKKSPHQIKIETTLLDSGWVRIVIADNGCGMSDETINKLFEPFFTTKPVGKGTGLGLSISYQIIVEKHGGKLFCHSTPSEGTQFVIELPNDMAYIAKG